MSGYAIAMGKCAGCDMPVAFNPVRVPSVRILNGKPDPNGFREPICRACAFAINKLRTEQGLPEHPIPADAYAPVSELEL